MGIRLLAILCVVGVVVSAVPAPQAQAVTAGRFDDDDGSIHEADIEALAAAGITLGCSADGTLFCPGDAVTREQMASFLARGLGLPSAPSAGFLDVVPGSVHSADIDSLAAAGITLGCSADGTLYCPGDAVTREQMASFLARGLGLPSAPSAGFLDVVPGSVHSADIDSLAAAGITLGCSVDGTLFCPGDAVTREQMASFLVRGLGLTPISPGVDFSSELTVAFLAMGQGDAAIYVGPCGEAALIDAPRQEAPAIKSRLSAWGITELEWILVSHYDSDNVGDVFELGSDPSLPVGLVYDRGGDRNANDTNSYHDYYDWVVPSGKRRSVEIGQVVSLCSGADTVTFTVVSVGTDGTAVGGIPVNSENDMGICLHVEFKDFDLATCGDINGTSGQNSADVESLAAAVIGDVEVARINRHGSSSSSNDTWRDVLSPELAILTVGVNVYGYPAPSVIAAWQESADVFKTNSEVDGSPVDGDVVISTRGAQKFRVTTSVSGLSRAYFLDEA